jgi:hypothetical protein
MIRVSRTRRSYNVVVFALGCPWLRCCSEKERRAQRQVHVDVMATPVDGEGSRGYDRCSGWDVKVSH